MAVTFSNIAQTAATAALAGIRTNQTAAPAVGPKSKEEAQALAIGKAAEANIIQPKEKEKGPMMGLKDKEKGPGLSLRTYNRLGQMGSMIAQKRAGAEDGFSGGLLSKKV